ncbi:MULTISPECIES: hypothetical protein [unclassified Vibrio]
MDKLTTYSVINFSGVVYRLMRVRLGLSGHQASTENKIGGV